MSLQLEEINLGTAPLGKDGDTQRTANDKTNKNMAKIAVAVDGKVDAAGGAFTQRPTFDGKTPWDSGNLPSPAQTTGADFTGDVKYATRLISTGRTANQVTGILARSPADDNFQLWVANGVVGGAGDIVARLVNVYSGVGENASIDFVRGGSTTNGWISFKQGGTEKAVLSASGFETRNAYFVAQQSTTAGSYAAVFYNGNGAVGSITMAGSTTSFNTSSDYRLKQNYAPIAGALESVNRMRFYRGEFKAAPGVQLDYMLAHELQEEASFAVTGEKDAVIYYPVFADGYDMFDVKPEDVVEVRSEIDPQRVDYSKLVPRMGAAIQELSTKLDAAVARIAQLESRQ